MKKVRQVVQIRKAHGFTQTYFAEKGGIKVGSYQNKEYGKSYWTEKEMPGILKEVQKYHPEATYDIFFEDAVYKLYTKE